MNTRDDLLNNDEMCSFYEDDIENMCSNKEYDTGECYIPEAASNQYHKQIRK